MHPMAAYCALKGLGLHCINPEDYRIMEADNEYLIGWTPMFEWKIYAFVGGFTYREISWDQIPDSVMDLLTAQTVNNLIGE